MEVELVEKANGKGRWASRPGGPTAPGRPLKSAELRELRRALLRRRLEILQDLQDLRDDGRWGRVGMDGRSDAVECAVESADAEIDAEIARGHWEQLREIDEAVAKFANGTYGLCETTGVPIGIERLRARPWAKYCLAHARELEQQGIRPRT